MFKSIVKIFVSVIITIIATATAFAGPIAKTDVHRTPTSAAAEVRQGKVGWLVVAKSIRLARRSQGRSDRDFRSAEDVAMYLEACTEVNTLDRFKRTYLGADGDVHVTEKVYEETVTAFRDPDGVLALMAVCLNGLVSEEATPTTVAPVRVEREDGNVALATAHVNVAAPATAPTVVFVREQQPRADYGMAFLQLLGAVASRPVIKNNGNTIVNAPDNSVRGSFNTRTTAIDARQNYNWQSWQTTNNEFVERRRQPREPRVPGGSPTYVDNSGVGVDASSLGSGFRLRGSDPNLRYLPASHYDVGSGNAGNLGKGASGVADFAGSRGSGMRNMFIGRR